jgi:hypothetical protein
MLDQDSSKEAQIWEALQFMIAEGLIKIDEEGLVYKR